VQSAIGDQLARELLAGHIRDGDTVRVDVSGDPLSLSVSGERMAEQPGPSG
jgi:ATP-dependent Clp protease ATP-binding subunit ClpB